MNSEGNTFENVMKYQSLTYFSKDSVRERCNQFINDTTNKYYKHHNRTDKCPDHPPKKLQVTIYWKLYTFKESTKRTK